MATGEKSEAAWQAEWDARTLADGEQIRSDAKRHTAAKKAAAVVAKDMEKAAKEQAKRTAAVKKIAATKVPAAKGAPKPKARPKATKRAPAKRTAPARRASGKRK